MVKLQDRFEAVIKLGLQAAVERSVMAFRHSCVIVTADYTRVLSIGYNSSNGGRLQRGMMSLHAESSAIKKAIRKHGRNVLVGANMFIFRATKSGHQSPVHVCSNCEFHIRKARIAKVYCYERETIPICQVSDSIEQLVANLTKRYGRGKKLKRVMKDRIVTALSDVMYT